MIEEIRDLDDAQTSVDCLVRQSLEVDEISADISRRAEQAYVQHWQETPSHCVMRWMLCYDVDALRTLSRAGEPFLLILVGFLRF